MDLEKLFSGDWFEFVCVNDKGAEATILLKLLPSTTDEANVFQNLPKDLSEDEKLERSLLMIASHIVDWDFTSGGQPVLCTDEMKMKVLKSLIFLKLKSVEGRESEQLSGEILRIVMNPANFLKN